MHEKHLKAISNILDSAEHLQQKKIITPENWCNYLNCLNFSAPIRMYFMTPQEKEEYKLFLEVLNTIDYFSTDSNNNKEVCDE